MNPIMKIELRSPTTITPYEGNPRQNDGAVDAVAKSLTEFGFRQPVVIDREGVVVCGHTRLKAALKLRLAEVPVHVAENLTPAQIRAYRIADNATSEIAVLDKLLLPLELNALKDLDFDLSLLGFDEDSLAKYLGTESAAGQCDADEVPDPPIEPVTAPGDLWLLGKHRLLCGDSTKSEDVQRLMDGESADLWLTDPPYGVSYVGKTKDSLTIQNDSLDDPSFREFLKSAFTNAFAAIKPGASFYIWHADSEGFNFRGAVRDCGQQVRQCLIWNKNVMVMGRQDYHWKHEPCLYGWKSGAAHGWYSDRSQTTVLEFDRPSRSEQHPTMKPVALFAYQVANNTAPQGLVLDTFLGSGTTLVAAQQLGRTCYGMELSPIYCDVIVSRWENFTGRKAERIEAATK
jgi:DNA modification methylase